MADDERASIENGIWLCQTHARLIDVDVVRFPAELLRAYKAAHEEFIETCVGAESKARLPIADRAETLGVRLEAADIEALDDAQKLAVLETLVAGVLADGRSTAGEVGMFKGVGQRVEGLKTPADTVATIMFAEQDLDQMEKNTLGALILAFGTTSDRVAVIKEAVTGRVTPPAARTSS